MLHKGFLHCRQRLASSMTCLLIFNHPKF
jgi:hypothetical protein